MTIAGQPWSCFTQVMSKSTIKSLKCWIAEAEERYEAAKARGETETYLAILRVKLDDLKDALATAEKRAAS